MNSYNVYYCQTGFQPKVIASFGTHSEAAAERDRLNAEERESNGGKLDGGHHYECDDKILTRYIAYSSTDLVIWGWGVGEDAARSDARDWISRNADQEDIPDIIDNLVTIRATDELCQRVKDLGGQCSIEFDHDQYGEFAR